MLKCLGKLETADIYNAVKNAKTVMEDRDRKKDKTTIYKGFEYYLANPATALGEIMDMILKDAQPSLL